MKKTFTRLAYIPLFAAASVVTSCSQTSTTDTTIPTAPPTPTTSPTSKAVTGVNKTLNGVNRAGNLARNIQFLRNLVR